MRVVPLEIPEVKLLIPDVWADARGYFFETFRDSRYAEIGISASFSQDNVSCSHRHVLRGLHYQWPNAVQGKLVSVLRGAVWDVAVDVRQGSSTFGRWVGYELTEGNHCQLWIPPGFAHGFVALHDDTLFTYKCTAHYSPTDERSIRWDDPALAIEWPVQAPLLSPKDAAAPLLREVPVVQLPVF